ncbi:TetR/AcrR family transcriptional regulator [Rhodococcus sp. NBC_00297]|uniref:TetR/AcrR family transcriptional regulator n=1 Tax=Rhodococcus sp. NBC_00297 TaxID=2976005 RepID=UPI002E2E0AC8|nr:TetR/AcrR family transcriptional regulator [Rhodococcus sp. NBC_00297]
MENRSTLLEQKREFTRTRLLDEALELFRTKGYVETTAEDIASAVGCSRATFYLHFKSKSEIMIGILERVWPSVDDSVDEFAAAVAAGLTKDELRVRISNDRAVWSMYAGGLRAFNVAQMVDPEVTKWLESKAARAVERVSRAAPEKIHMSPRVQRTRIVILSRIANGALEMEDSVDCPSSEVVDYLTDLWADLICV